MKKIKYILPLFWVALATVTLSLLANYLRRTDQKSSIANPGHRGVIVNEKQSSPNDLTLISLAPRQAAHLMDLEGNLVHSWTAPISDFNYSDKDHGCFFKNQKAPWKLFKCGWQAVALDPHEDLIVVAGQQFLAKLDWNSNILWKIPGVFHHDISVTQEGFIFALEKQFHSFRWNGEDFKIIDEVITKISPDGKILKRVSLLSLFQPFTANANSLLIKGFFEKETSKEIDPYTDENQELKDMLHSNGIQYIEFNIPNLCKKGDLLVSVRKLNLIGLLDFENEKVRWTWGQNELTGQHSPSVLKEGTILIFDNRENIEISRVLEVNPKDWKVAWVYGPQDTSRFFTKSNGRVQRLQNGNTLITSSLEGRMFEVTKGGKVIWDYLSPLYIGPDSRKIPMSIVYSNRISRNKNNNTTHSSK
jgi:hypothetical protein